MMDFNTTEIWQHVKSGEWYLVAVNEAGEIREACGPVSRDDAEYTVNEAAGFFNDEDGTAEWIAERRDEFQPAYR